MRNIAVATVALFALAGRLGGAEKTWVGSTSSNWFEATNWDPPEIPLSTDSVAVTNFTTVIVTGEVSLAALEVRRATLVISNQLTATNLVLSEGARLTAWFTPPNPFTNPPSGSGVVEIPIGGTLRIGQSPLGGSPMIRLEGTKLNLRGTGFCTNNGSVLLFYRSEFNVYGTFAAAGEVNFDGANGPPSGSLNIYGVLQRPSGTNLSFLSANLTNRGSIFVESGTMNIGNGLNSGRMDSSFGATQSFIGNFSWEAGGRFTGGGTVRLTRGVFDPGTNDLFIPQLHWTGATLIGTNTVTVQEWVWDGGWAYGKGEIIAAANGHLTLRGGNEKFLSGERRLIIRGKASFSTNALFYLTDKASCINQGFAELGPGARIGLTPVAAEPPERFFRNEGTLLCLTGATNVIWSRFTNAGTLRVNGRLQASGPVQSAGMTHVNGSLVTTFPGYRINAGILGGTGVVEGIVRNSGSITPGASIGQLTVQGSLTNRGNIFIEIGSDSGSLVSDLLSVSNHLKMGGTLGICYSGTEWPVPGDSWEVLRFGSSTGQFTTFEGLDLGGGRVLQQLFSPTNLVLVLSNQTVQKYFFTTVRCVSGELELRFTGDPGQTFIDTSTNLTDWSTVLSTNSVDGIVYFRSSLSGSPQRFFRARQVP